MKYLNKNPDFEMTTLLPRITLYSSASRRSSITSAVGNGFASDLLGTLLSNIRTVLPDFLFLQIINFACNNHVIIVLRYHRVFTPIGIVVDAILLSVSSASSFTKILNLTMQKAVHYPDSIVTSL